MLCKIRKLEIFGTGTTPHQPKPELRLRALGNPQPESRDRAVRRRSAGLGSATCLLAYKKAKFKQKISTGRSP